MHEPALLFGSTVTDRLGPVWVALSPRGLVAVEFGVLRARFEAALRTRTGHQIQYAPHRVRHATLQIKQYVEGRRRVFDLPIDWSIMASDFQRRALKAVASIPYGATRTYSDIATEIGRPNAARAVGRANALNPMPLVIPCHRVIGADGKLHGYGGAGGLRTKAWLLKMESSL